MTFYDRYEKYVYTKPKLKPKLKSAPKHKATKVTKEKPPKPTPPAGSVSVLGYSRYVITPSGEIFDLDKSRFVKTFVEVAGEKQYVRVNLHTDAGMRKKAMVHRLLAVAFLLNPEQKHFLIHLNRNTLDNRVENLRWLSGKENQCHEKKLLIFSINNQT